MWLAKLPSLKRTIILSVLFLLFALQMSDVSASQTAPSPARKPLICSEEDGIIFRRNEGVYEIYDAWGNLRCELRRYIEYFFPRVTSLNSIFVDQDRNENRITIVSPGAGEHYMTLSGEEYNAVPRDQYVQITSLHTGSSTIYDSAFRPVGPSTKELTGPFDPKSIASHFYLLDSGFLYGTCSGKKASWVYASRDGSYSYELTQDHPLLKIILEILSQPSDSYHPRLYAFGDYIVDVTSFEENNGKVYNLEGELVFERACGFTRTALPMSSIFRYPDQTVITKNYLIRLEGNEYGIYDTALNRIGAVPQESPEEQWEGIAASDSVIQGLPCAALDGAVCEGFIPHIAKGAFPYCKTGNTLKIAADNGLLYLDIPEEEEIVRINDHYCQTVQKIPYGEKTQSLERFYYFSDHQPLRLMLVSDPDSYRKTADSFSKAELTKDGLLVKNYISVEHDSYSTTEISSNVIYGPDGSVTCQLGSDLVHIIEDGIIYLYRGIYEGVIDNSGAWIFKKIRPLYSE